MLAIAGPNWLIITIGYKKFDYFFKAFYFYKNPRVSPGASGSFFTYRVTHKE